MDYILAVKDACDSIEERIYELNGLIRDKDVDGEVVLELDNIIKIVKDIKNNVNEKNCEESRDELLKIQTDLENLFERNVVNKR